MKRLRIKESFKFFLERQFVKGAHIQLMFVALLIGLITVIGALVVMPAEEQDRSTAEESWWAFLRLTDPGYLGDDSGIWRRFISTILTLLGYVVFLGSLVAIITTWLNKKIRNLEQGLTPVTAKNHILILGWNSKAIYAAGEIFQSVGRLRRFLKFYGARRLNLIILSEDVSPLHLQELRDNPLIGKGAEDIILRSGNSIDREHLRRVDSLNAAAIIIPSAAYSNNELITPDVETIKTLLSISAEAEDSLRKEAYPYVVAEIQDKSKIKAAYRSYNGPIEVIGSNTIISRLLAQNIRHTGLSNIYNELLNHSVKNNLFCREYKESFGKKIFELKHSFPKAIIIGVVRQINHKLTPILNTSNDFVVEQNDRLIFIAKKSADIDSMVSISGKRINQIQVKNRLKIEKQDGVVKILILGWNHHIPALVEELCSYDNEYYDITMVAVLPKERRKAQLGKLDILTNRVNLRHVEEDYVNETALHHLNPSSYDNILLVSSERILEKEEADARTIVGYVLLEELLGNLKNRPKVLLELSDPDNEALLRKYKTEVIISPLILSNLLAGIALQREINSICKDLFTSGGAEIIFRNHTEYGLSEGAIAFTEVEDKASEFGEIALGIFNISPMLKNDKKLHLNPEKHEILELNTYSRLVVLTTVY